MEERSRRNALGPMRLISVESILTIQQAETPVGRMINYFCSLPYASAALPSHGELSGES